MRRILLFSTTLISLTLFAIMIQQPASVQADAAPPPVAVGSDLFPNSNQTKVRMEAETVLITIPEDSESTSGHAIVNATFYMRNMGDEIEQMNVRFPLNLSEYDLEYEVDTNNDYCPESSLTSYIEEFSVKTTYEENDENTPVSTSEKASTSTNHCWATFDVTFPPGEQVIIEIQYKMFGNPLNETIVNYSYILQTGIGWYDTIGSADIIIELPYYLDETSIRSCNPEDCTIQLTTVSWHYEDFEPDENISVDMITPSIWGRVVRETANVQINNSDGHAWGRLGDAYKDLITDQHGFLVESEFPEFFESSMKAYQNAIYVRPYDVNWHVSYTDLVCPYAVKLYYAEQEDAKKYAQICGIEIDTILTQNPNNPNIMQYLKFLYDTYPAFFVDNNFNIFADEMRMPTLAPIPTDPTSTPTSKATATSATVIPAATRTPTQIISADMLPTPTFNPFGNVEPQEPFVDDSIQHKQNWFSFFGNLVLLGIAALIYSIQKKK
jgi:hypothetical protein